VIESYAQFARHLGIAFQIRDDYLGAWGDEEKTGKSATSDIREKKKAYPILVAFERANESERAALRSLYAQEVLSDADVKTVLAMMGQLEAAAETDRAAGEYYNAAMAHLDRTGITSATQDQIRQLAAFLIERAY
jgi:geranylgeranyl diphosphate synthase type I